MVNPVSHHPYVGAAAADPRNLNIRGLGENSVQEVALPALESGMRVLSGQYHFDENVLVLEVEKKMDGQEKTVKEKVAFELVGLRYKDKNQQFVDVLGVRSHPVMQKLIEKLIDQLKTLKNPEAFVLSQGQESEKEQTLTTLKLGHFNQKVEKPGRLYGVRIQNQEGTFARLIDQKILDEYKTSPVQFSTLTENANDQKIKAFIHAEEWQILLKEVNKKQGSKHAFTFLNEFLEQDQKVMEDVVQALFDVQEGEEKSLYRSLLENSSSLRRQLKQVEKSKKVLTQVQLRLKQELQEQRDLYENHLDALEENFLYQKTKRELYSYTRSLEELLTLEKQLKKAYQTLKELDVFNRSRQFENQRNLEGSAALGKLLTHDLHDLLKSKGLFKEHEMSIENFLKDQLGFDKQDELNQSLENCENQARKLIDLYQFDDLNIKESEKDDESFVSAISDTKSFHSAVEEPEVHSIYDFDENVDERNIDYRQAARNLNYLIPQMLLKRADLR